MLLLLSKEIAMSMRDSKEGAMPTYITVDWGHLGVVLDLLDHGCDIEAKNKFGLPPGLFAYKSGFSIAAQIESYSERISQSFPPGLS